MTHPTVQGYAGYAAIIEEVDGYFSAYVPDLPGCISVGRTAAEAAHNIREAIKLLAAVGAPAQLQILDAKSAEWRSVRVRKDPGCKVCAS